MPALSFRASVLVIACLLGCMIAPAAHAQRPEVFQAGQQQFGANLAVSGFDPVAYHTQNQAVPGRPEFRVSWKGAEWRFATQANRDAFVAAPDRYAPQFGGYCAFAVASNAIASADPRSFAVVNGKLYLNQSPSIHASWLRDQAGFIRRAEANWPRVLGN
ncbi:MAG: YHS domain-containing (seleno)protein [Hyphomicrobiaceae bacterium]